MSAQPQITDLEPVTEEKKMARYEWQPTDENGTSIGGKQVVEYEDGNLNDLATKMADTNVNLQRELRKIKRDRELGTEELPEIDEVKPLSAEERLRLAREIVDPEKCDAAADRLLEASPKFRRMASNARASREHMEGVTFRQTHPDFYPCRENAEALVRWCRKHQPGELMTVNLFEKAFAGCREAGLLLETPIAAEEPRANSQPEQEDESRITPEPVVPDKRPMKTSTALTRDMGTPGPRPAAVRNKLSWADVDRLSASDYDKKMREPEFVKALNALPPR